MSSPGSSTCPLRVFDVVVRRVRQLSPHVRRITFGGPGLERFGVPGPTLDLRIKLLLPVPGHALSRPGSSDGELQEGWYQDWLRIAQPGRGWLRSYTVRALRATPDGQELDIDFVIHVATHPDSRPVYDRFSAPASDWARAAEPGSTAVLVGPDAISSRTAPPAGTGIRWDPQGARQVLLAGDETAVPAVSSILEGLPAAATGRAFLEVPDDRDFQDLRTESGVVVTWLARNPTEAPRGQLLCDAIRRSYVAGEASEEMYAWVAAEASTVKNLRSYLVQHLGMDPKRSELRAYWSLGKAGSGANGIPVKQQAS